MQYSKVSLAVPSSLRILLEGVSRAVVLDNPDNIAEFFALYFQDLLTFQKGHPNLDLADLVEKFECTRENGNKRLEEETSEYRVTLFSGEPKRRDKCTDTEEDQILEEPDIQYSSRVTQHPSTTSSIAGSDSTPGSDAASSPEEAELVYIPAEPAQLAAHMLGNSDSVYSLRDVSTSVQTFHEDSQTSENEFTPSEGAAEDASAAPAAETPVEAVRSQSGVWSQSSTAGELGPSGSQADVSTNDVNQDSSSVSLWEEPSPSALSPPPSPAPEDPLQALPSCNKAEVTSTAEVVSLCWDDKLIMEPEVPPYIEQFPQKIIIPFIDQTAYLLKIKQPIDAGPSETTLCPSDDDLVYHPERTESTARVESAEQVYVLSAMASSEAGRLQPHTNVWTLYCLTDLRQGQKSPRSLPPAGAGGPCSQATLSLSGGEDQQWGQLSQVSAPIYVMQEGSKRENAPPFILVGSNVQNAEDWKPIPSHAVFAQREAGVGRRFTTVPVPVARPAAEETAMASCNSHSAEETGARPPIPSVFSVAILLDDVKSAEKGSRAGGKHTGVNALTGPTTTASGPIPRAGSRRAKLASCMALAQ